MIPPVPAARPAGPCPEQELKNNLLIWFCILNAACISALSFTALLTKVTLVCLNRLNAEGAMKANLSEATMEEIIGLLIPPPLFSSLIASIGLSKFEVFNVNPPPHFLLIVLKEEATDPRTPQSSFSGRERWSP